MKHDELLEENCAIARTSAVIGERWVWMILRQAFNGARRFEEFRGTPSPMVLRRRYAVSRGAS